MADPVARLVVDCSVVVKWNIPLEDYAAAAEELLLDWEHQAVAVSAPKHLQSEIISAVLRVHRRGRITASVFPPLTAGAQGTESWSRDLPLTGK